MTEKLKARKKVREDRSSAKAAAERFEMMVSMHIEQASLPWPFPKMTREKAEAAVRLILKNEKKKKEDGEDIYRMYADSYECFIDRASYASSAPTRPAGLDDAPTIRKLAEVVRAIPGATLTVPVETIQLIAKHATPTNNQR